MHLQATPRYNTWVGLSFERLCFAHIYEIQRALGVTGVATKTYSYTTPTAQMDMVIERADRVTTLCEMKYTQKPYQMSKSEADKLRNRAEELAMLQPTQRQIQIVLISNRNAKKNINYNSLVVNNITLKDIFKS